MTNEKLNNTMVEVIEHLNKDIKAVHGKDYEMHDLVLSAIDFIEKELKNK